MRVIALILTVCVALVGLASGRERFNNEELGFNISTIVNGSGNAQSDAPKSLVLDTGLAGTHGQDDPPVRIPDPNTVYGKAWCRGARLQLAMTLNRDQAVLHIRPIET